MGTFTAWKGNSKLVAEAECNFKRFWFFLMESLELSDTHIYKMDALQMLGRQNLEIDRIILPLIMLR